MKERAFELHHRSEQAAGPLPPLLLAAEKVASTVAQGVHGRRRVGQGETFWQFRPYDPGDRPQSIDWRQSAKSDHVFVRETEWEAAQSAWIWRDCSASMSWASSAEGPDKRSRADVIALALAVLLVRAGERVALLGSEQSPSGSRASLPRLAAAMTGEGIHGTGVPPTAAVARFGQLVLIGDFLAPLEDLNATLRHFVEHGVRGQILQVLDPAEESLPYSGRIHFEGLEDERPWLLSRVEGVRERYIERLRAQQEGLRALARVLGWGYQIHHTNHSPETALLALFTALSATRR